MSKIQIKKPEKLYFTYPNSVAVICVECKKKVYVMPAAWQIPLSYSPAIYGVLVSPTRYTFRKLFAAKNFTLNYFSYDHANLIAQIGSCSGSTINKIKKFRIKLSPSTYVKSPILTDAYVSLECAEVKSRKYGDHVLFSGKVKNVWYDANKFKNNIIKIKSTKPLLYLGNFTFTTINDKKSVICQKNQYL